MSKTTKQPTAYSVKVRLKSNSPGIKFKRSIVEGISVHVSQKLAREKVLNKLNRELSQHDAYAEIISSVKIRQDFVYGNWD